MSSLNSTSDSTHAEMRTIDTQPFLSGSRTSSQGSRTSGSRSRTSSQGSGSSGFEIRRRLVALGLALAIALAAASPAFADRYDKRRAGHPLRIAAYIVYPIGALLDVLIMRPAHWLVSQEPFKSAMGHED